MKKVILLVEGMHCEMCESHVNDLIRKSIDAKKVKSSATKGESSFVIDDCADYSKVIESIQNDGYKVLGHKEEPYERKFLWFKLK